MKISGKCHCGAIGINGVIDVENAMACHCTDCQVFSGAPYRAVVICKAANFSVEGNPKEYVKIADSGNQKIQGFCDQCGTQLFATDFDKTVFNIRVGFLEQRDALRPRKHIFGSSSRDWINSLKDDQWRSLGPASDAMDPI